MQKQRSITERKAQIMLECNKSEAVVDFVRLSRTEMARGTQWWGAGRQLWRRMAGSTGEWRMERIWSRQGAIGRRLVRERRLGQRKAARYRRGRRGDNMKGIDADEADCIMLCRLVSRDSQRRGCLGRSAVWILELTDTLSSSQQLENRRCKFGGCEQTDGEMCGWRSVSTP